MPKIDIHLPQIDLPKIRIQSPIVFGKNAENREVKALEESQNDPSAEG